MTAAGFTQALAQRAKVKNSADRSPLAAPSFWGVELNKPFPGEM